MERPPAKIDADSEDFAGLSSAYDFFDDERDLESQSMPPNMIHEQRDIERLQLVNMMKREKLEEVLHQKPTPGVAYHVIGNGSYDFFTFIPVLIDLLGGSCQDFYGSTWTMNRGNVLQLFDLFDQSKIRSINIVTGTYFKRRESAVYATLLQGIQGRRQRFKCFENHAKIVLLSNPDAGDFLTVEGSANFTANPRVEQYVINNSWALFEFHRTWMDKYLNE